MRILLPAVSLSLLMLGAGVSTSFQDQSTEQPRTTISPKEERKRALAEMQGAWKLTDFESRTARKELRKDVGYCVISGNYLAIEVHLWWDPARGRPPRGDFFTGVHRFEFDDTQKMVTTSLIDTLLDPDGRIIHQPPGKTRNYQVEIGGNVMRLVRDDQQVFVFERVSQGQQEFDIFGRPIPEKSEHEEPKK